ncbi:MAG: ABC transporter permease [Sphingomonadaceae bacterium]|nr:ABC transporter permease [Sphingomonadaceae bacterium]
MIFWLKVAMHHLRFINLSFWRNPSAAFFGIVFPLMILSINSAIFGRETIHVHGAAISAAAFYVAGMSVFAVMMTCFTNLATSVVFDRDMGRLKRIRGTPTPVSAYVCARLVFAIGAGLLTSLLCVADGALFFGVAVSGPNLLLFLATIVIGSASIGAVALAAASAIPNAQAAPAMLNAATFPILFLSNVFYPVDSLPGWLIAITRILPIRPLGSAAIGAFFGRGLSLSDLAIVLAWGVFGALFAARFFRWQPRR